MRILRGLTSRILPCGCLAGVYETYEGGVVSILDERSATCRDPNHQIGRDIPELRGATPSRGSSTGASSA
jgi:hypothetical protein